MVASFGGNKIRKRYGSTTSVTTRQPINANAAWEPKYTRLGLREAMKAANAVTEVNTVMTTSAAASSRSNGALVTIPQMPCELHF